MRSLIIVCALIFSKLAFAQTQFHTVPAQPKIGESISVFLHLETQMTKNEIVIEANLDTTVNVRFVKTADQLWVAHLKPYHEIKSHTLEVDLFLQDEKEAVRNRSARSTLTKEITEIETLLLTENNAEIIQRLQDDKVQKQKYIDQLLVDYANLKTFFKSETYSFDIQPDPANTQYPLITAVTQNAVPLGKRIVVQITGQNFGSNPVVKFGGQNGTVQTVSPTQIEVLAPNFSTTGSKDIEILFPPVGNIPRKNTILTNSFFVSDQPILKNIRPVVVTSGFIRVIQTVPASITLSAVGSYDENADPFSYEWSVTRIPVGSTLAVGSLLANSASPTFTPDVKGIYTFRVRLKETSTLELLTSLYSTTTVEVK